MYYIKFNDEELKRNVDQGSQTYASWTVVVILSSLWCAKVGFRAASHAICSMCWSQPHTLHASCGAGLACTACGVHAACSTTARLAPCARSEASLNHAYILVPCARSSQGQFGTQSWIWHTCAAHRDSPGYTLGLACATSL